jgi:hypothetical protein
MIEHEEWYDTYFVRRMGGHYCTECECSLSTDYECVLHLLREHDFESVDVHEDW